MRIPKSWNEITIGQFQECYFILKNRSIDSWIKVISIFSGLTCAELESIPITRLKSYIKKLQFLLNPSLNTNVKRYIYVNKRIYKAIYKPSDLNTAQVNDIKSFLKCDGDYNDNIVANANKLLASVYWPLTWKGFVYGGSEHEKIAEDFKKVKMGDVYGTLFFYSKTFQELIKPTLTYFDQNQQLIQEHMTEVEKWLKESEITGAGR